MCVCVYRTNVHANAYKIGKKNACKIQDKNTTPCAHLSFAIALIASDMDVARLFLLLPASPP